MKFWAIKKEDLTDHEYRELVSDEYSMGLYRLEDGTACKIEHDPCSSPLEYSTVGVFEGDPARWYSDKNCPANCTSTDKLKYEADDDYDDWPCKYKGDVAKYLHDEYGYSIVIPVAFRGYSQGEYLEGWYCCDAKTAHKNFGNGPQAFKKARNCMDAELKFEWEPWFRGDVWRVVFPEGSPHESLDGYYGDDAEVILGDYFGERMTEARGESPHFQGLQADEEWIDENAPLLEMAGE